ncbi:MAG: hypothetical protein ACK5MT_05405 [Actinomycetales bacterium]
MPVGDQLLVVGDVVHAGELHRAAPLVRWNHAFATVAELPERSGVGREG